MPLKGFPINKIFHQNAGQMIYSKIKYSIHLLYVRNPDMKHMSMVMASGVILAIIIGIVGIACADDVLLPKSMQPSGKFNSSDVKSMQPSKGISYEIPVSSMQPSGKFNSSDVKSMQPSQLMFK